MSSLSGNEAEALLLVEKYMTIPAPLWVDEYPGTHPILIMTAVAGQTLDKVFYRLSYTERKQLSKDLKSVVSQLRCIPNRTPYIFGNSHGGPLRNHRFPSGTCGPFNSIFDFKDFLVHPYVRKETKRKFRPFTLAHTDLFSPMQTCTRAILFLIAGAYLGLWIGSALGFILSTGSTRSSCMTLKCSLKFDRSFMRRSRRKAMRKN